MENWTNLDKGREGVKNPGNFADIICTWPLMEIFLGICFLSPSECTFSAFLNKMGLPGSTKSSTKKKPTSLVSENAKERLKEVQVLKIFHITLHL